MHYPYGERLTKVYELVKSKGDTTSQNKFCKAIGIIPSNFPAIKRGERPISLDIVINLKMVFGVSLSYTILGIEPIMDPEPRKLSREEETELEKRLAVVEATARLQQTIIEDKNRQIEKKDEQLARKDEQLAQKEAEIKKLLELLGQELDTLRKKT